MRTRSPDGKVEFDFDDLRIIARSTVLNGILMSVAAISMGVLFPFDEKSVEAQAPKTRRAPMVIDSFSSTWTSLPGAVPSLTEAYNRYGMVSPY